MRTLPLPQDDNWHPTGRWQITFAGSRACMFRSFLCHCLPHKITWHVVLPWPLNACAWSLKHSRMHSRMDSKNQSRLSCVLGSGPLNYSDWCRRSANDSNVCLWMANWSRTRRFLSSWSWYVMLASISSTAPALPLTVLRWNQLACLSGDPPGWRQIRDHSVQVSLDRGSKAGWRSKVIRLLRRMP